MPRNHLTELLQNKDLLEQKLSAFNDLFHTYYYRAEDPDGRTTLDVLPEFADFSKNLKNVMESMQQFYLMDAAGNVPQLSPDALQKLTAACSELGASAEKLKTRFEEPWFQNLLIGHELEVSFPAFLDEVRGFADSDAALLDQVKIEEPQELSEIVRIGEQGEAAYDRKERKDTALNGLEAMQKKLSGYTYALKDAPDPDDYRVQNLQREMEALDRTINYTQKMLGQTPVLRTGVYLSNYLQQLIRVDEAAERILKETKDRDTDFYRNLQAMHDDLNREDLKNPGEIVAIRNGIERQREETPDFNLVTMEQVRTGKQQAEQALQQNPADMKAAAAWIIYGELERVGEDGIRQMGYSRRHLAEDLKRLTPEAVKAYLEDISIGSTGSITVDDRLYNEHTVPTLDSFQMFETNKDDEKAFDYDETQGYVDDYPDFYNAVTSISRGNREKLQQIITDNGDDNTVTVHLNLSNGGEDPTPVNVTVTRERIGVPRDGDPLWVQMVAKALIAVKGMEDPEFRKTGTLDTKLLKQYSSNQLTDMLLPPERRVAVDPVKKPDMSPAGALMDEVHRNDCALFTAISQAAVNSPANQQERYTRKEPEKTKSESEQLHDLEKALRTPSAAHDSIERDMRRVHETLFLQLEKQKPEDIAAAYRPYVEELNDIAGALQKLGAADKANVQFINDVSSFVSDIDKEFSAAEQGTSVQAATAACRLLDGMSRLSARSAQLMRGYEGRGVTEESTAVLSAAEDLMVMNRMALAHKDPRSEEALKERLAAKIYTGHILNDASEHKRVLSSQDIYLLRSERANGEDIGKLLSGSFFHEKYGKLSAEELRNTLAYTNPAPVRDYEDHLNRMAEVARQEAEAARQEAERSAFAVPYTRMLRSFYRNFESSFAANKEKDPVGEAYAEALKKDFAELRPYFRGSGSRLTAQPGLYKALQDFLDKADRAGSEFEGKINELTDSRRECLRAISDIRKLNSMFKAGVKLENNLDAAKELFALKVLNTLDDTVFPNRTPVMEDQMLNAVKNSEVVTKIFSVRNANDLLDFAEQPYSDLYSFMDFEINEYKRDLPISYLTLTGEQTSQIKSQAYLDEDEDYNLYEDEEVNAEFERQQKEKQRIREAENQALHKEAEKFGETPGLASLFKDVFRLEDESIEDYLYSYGQVLSENYNRNIAALPDDKDFKAYKDSYAGHLGEVMRMMNYISPNGRYVEVNGLTEDAMYAAGYHIASAINKVYDEGRAYVAHLNSEVGPEKLTDDQINCVREIGKTELFHEILNLKLRPAGEEAMQMRLINVVILSAAARDMRSEDPLYREDAWKLLSDEKYRREIRTRLLLDPEFKAEADKLLKSLKSSPESADEKTLAACVNKALEKEHGRQNRLREQREREEAYKKATELHTEKYKELKKAAENVNASPAIAEYNSLSEAIRKAGGTAITVPGRISEEQTTDLMHAYTAELADMLVRLQAVQDKAAPGTALPFKDPKDKLTKLYSYLNVENGNNHKIILKAAKDIYEELAGEKAEFAASLNKNQLLNYDQLDQLDAFNRIGSPEQVYSELQNPENTAKTARRGLNLGLVNRLKAEPELLVTEPELRDPLLYPEKFEAKCSKEMSDPATNSLFKEASKKNMSDDELMNLLKIEDYKKALGSRTKEILKGVKSDDLKKIQKVKPESIKTTLQNNIRILKELTPDHFDINLQRAQILTDAADPKDTESVNAALAAYVDCCNKITRDFIENRDQIFSGDPDKKFADALQLEYTAEFIGRGMLNLDVLFSMESRLAARVFTAVEISDCNNDMNEIRQRVLYPDDDSEPRYSQVKKFVKDPDFKAMLLEAVDAERKAYPGKEVEARTAALKKLLSEDDKILLAKYTDIRNRRLEVETKKATQAAVEKRKLEMEKRKAEELKKQQEKQEKLEAEKEKKLQEEKLQEEKLREEKKEEKILIQDREPAAKNDRNIIDTNSDHNNGMREKDDSEDLINQSFPEKNKEPEQKNVAKAPRSMTGPAFAAYVTIFSELCDEIQTTDHTYHNSETYDNLKIALEGTLKQIDASAKVIHEATKKGDTDGRQKEGEKLFGILKKNFNEIQKKCNQYVKEHQPEPAREYGKLKLSETQRSRLAVISEFNQLIDHFKEYGDPASVEFSKKRAALKLVTRNAIRVQELGIDTKTADYKHDGFGRRLLLDSTFRDSAVEQVLNDPSFKKMCLDQQKKYEQKHARKLKEKSGEDIRKEFYSDLASRSSSKLYKTYKDKAYDQPKKSAAKDTGKHPVR